MPPQDGDTLETPILLVRKRNGALVNGFVKASASCCFEET